MATFIDFEPTATQPFRANVTLDDAQYNIVVSWGLWQRWYMNLFQVAGPLVRAFPLIASPDPLPLAVPLETEAVQSMVWDGSVEGGQVTVIMAVDSIFTLGDQIQVQGATNTGTGGDGAINSLFAIDTWTDPRHFTFLLTAAPGVIGTVGGSPVLVLTTYAQTWSNATGVGLVTAHTAAPHKLPLGVPVDLTIAGTVPAGYDGRFRCTATTPSDFTYELQFDPGIETTPGTYSPDISLVGGYFNSTIIWRPTMNRFEVSP